MLPVVAADWIVAVARSAPADWVDADAAAGAAAVIGVGAWAAWLSTEAKFCTWAVSGSAKTCWIAPAIARAQSVDAGSGAEGAPA